MRAWLVMASRMEPEGGWQLNPKPVPRVKNVPHRGFIKTLPCICCLVGGLEVQADDPMHLRAGSALHGKEPAGGAQTADDRWTLPGCRPHHDGQHGVNEVWFWVNLGIDPFLLALTLFGLSGRYYEAVLVLREHADLARRRRGVSPGWWATFPLPAKGAPVEP